MYRSAGVHETAGALEPGTPLIEIVREDVTGEVALTVIVAGTNADVTGEPLTDADIPDGAVAVMAVLGNPLAFCH
jgi:hypothetical protein